MKKARLPAVLLVSVAAALAPGACDDISPVSYDAPPIREAGLADQVDAAAVAACRQCTSADGAICRPHYDSCIARDPRCEGFLECMVGADCWREVDASNLADVPACALACFAKTNISSVNDIASPALDFFLCLLDLNRCGPVCVNPPPL